MIISILCKGMFSSQVPLMTLALVAKELGHDIEVVTSSCEKRTEERYAGMGITVVSLCPEITFPVAGILGKIRFWRAFSKRAWSHLANKSPNNLLWIGSADTALALGKRLFARTYVLHIRELYDTVPHYRRALAKYAGRAKCVVVPEMCRAAILRSWYGLHQTPFVLPNKPAEHPKQRNLVIEDPQASAALASLHPNERIVLYQGHLGLGRDVLPVAEAVRRMGNGWRFVVMGPGNADYIARLTQNYPEVIHVPRVSAPLHLQITSRATIGVIVYGWDKLNNVFCAPNKIWEYAGFGLPMLCSDLPALQLTVQASGAGICVDMTDSIQMATALQQMGENYDQFSQSSVRFYDAVDIRSIIQLIFLRAGIFEEPYSLVNKDQLNGAGT